MDKPSLWEKIGGVLTSRKFWALATALVATAAAFGGGNITAWQAVQAVVAATAAYALGTAIEDAG